MIVDRPAATAPGLVPDSARLRHVVGGATWSEGPVWLPELAVLRWSDIPGDRILEVDPELGEVRVHRTGVEFTNGRTLDLEGHVVQCSHGRRAVEREYPDGRLESIADSWNGRRLNSPNDVIVASDGAVWFTDPPYGIVLPHEGHPGDPEYGGCYVFRIDPDTGTVDAVITDIEEPNGLAFSPDESVLYVTDTSSALRQDGTGNHHILAYDVSTESVCDNRRIFAVIEPGVADGIRVDEQGRVWSSSADSVQIFAPDGELIGRIPVPEIVGNLCFGGPAGDELYVAASTSIYRISTNTRAATRPTRAARA